MEVAESEETDARETESLAEDEDDLSVLMVKSESEERELNITVTLAACSINSPEESSDQPASLKTAAKSQLEEKLCERTEGATGQADPATDQPLLKLAEGSSDGAQDLGDKAEASGDGAENQSKQDKLDLSESAAEASQMDTSEDRQASDGSSVSKSAAGSSKKIPKKSKSDTVASIARRETRASRLRAANKPQPSKSEIAQLSLDHEPPPPPSTTRATSTRENSSNLISKTSRLKKPEVGKSVGQKQPTKVQPSKENCPPMQSGDTKQTSALTYNRRLSGRAGRLDGSASTASHGAGEASVIPAASLSNKIQKRKTDPSPTHVPNKKAASAGGARSARAQRVSQKAAAVQNLDSSMDSNTHSEATMDSSFESGASGGSRGHSEGRKPVVNGKSNLPMKTTKLRKPLSHKIQSTNDDQGERETAIKTKIRKSVGTRDGTTGQTNGSLPVPSSGLRRGKAVNKATELLKYRTRTGSPSSDSQLSGGSSVSDNSRGSSLQAHGVFPTNDSNQPLATRSTSAAALRIQKSYAQSRSSKFGRAASQSSSSPGQAASTEVSKKPDQTRIKDSAASSSTTPVAQPNSQQNSSLRSQQNLQLTELSAETSQNVEPSVNQWQVELAQLEAKCHSRDKEVTQLRIQLKYNATGFQALSVLVSYLAHKLKAFDNPELTKHLEATRAELCEANKHLASLVQQRDALIEEIKSLKAQHQTDLEEKEADHQLKLKAQQDQLQQAHQQLVAQVRQSHEEDKGSLLKNHKSAIHELQEKHESERQQQEDCHQACVEQLRADHQAYLQNLQSQHQEQMDDITRRVDNIKMTLSNKVESLRQECDELRSRERRYMEQHNRDVEVRVQTAISSYRHLPAEIESLRAVLEMKTQEVHELRKQKQDLHHQLDELPAAREKVTSLEQQIENLEAIVTIKTDYEKELSEKYANLVRRYDRESKANKRLSMDNDQLQWRLQQEDATGSGQRSLSHSPTSSACSTPEPLRRHSPRSPLPQSPRGYVGQVQRSVSGSGYEADRPGTTLRRHQRMSCSLIENSQLRSPQQLHKTPKSPIYVFPTNGDTPTSTTEDSLNDNTVMNTSSKSEPASSMMQSFECAVVKRSGTYELLEDEANGAMQLKQSDV